MLDHIHEQDRRINILCKSMKEIDKNFESLDLSSLDEADFKVVEDADAAQSAKAE